MKTSRRKFMTAASSLTLAATTPILAMQQSKSMLVHHVFFWLKNPASKEDRSKLIEGIKTLEKIETVRMLHVGIPAGTEKRAVVDHSYSVSELIFFDDVSGQNVYQEHPIHKAFVEKCAHLWDKVLVYDTMSA